MIAHRVWLLPVTVICLATAGAGAGAGAPDRRIARRWSASRRRYPGRSTAWCSTKPASPIDGVVVSALGGATAFAVTDQAGQYRLRNCRPGPYVVRAHREGFAQVAQHARQRPLRAAGRRRRSPCAAPMPPAEGAGGRRRRGRRRGRVRAARRERGGVAAASPEAQRAQGRNAAPAISTASTSPADDDWFLEDSIEFIGRAFESSARLATSLFTDSPLYGQFNLLTATAYDDSGELVAFGQPSGVAFFAVGAPVGQHGDWAARVAMNSGDVSSWTMAGDYVSRASAQPATGRRHDLQPAALRGWQLRGAPGGARRPSQGGVARGRPRRRLIAALDRGLRRALRALRLPRRLRARQPVGPGSRLRRCPRCASTPGRRASRWRRAPRSSCRRPMRSGCRRSARSRRIGEARFSTESVQHYEVGATRQFRGFSVGVRGFRQVDRRPAGHRVRRPRSRRGWSRRAATTAWPSAGDAAAAGLGRRVEHACRRTCAGSVDYALVSAEWESPSEAESPRPGGVAPRALRQPHERLHDLTTSFEAEIPQTATRFFALYKLNSGFAGDPHMFQSADGASTCSCGRACRSWAAWRLGDAGRRAQPVPHRVRRPLVLRRAAGRAPPKRVMGGLQVRF